MPSVQPHLPHEATCNLKHVASVTSCRDGLASGDFEKITEAHSTKLDNADRAETRAARKSGIRLYRSHGLRAHMITRANLFDTSSTCFFTMRFFLDFLLDVDRGPKSHRLEEEVAGPTLWFVSNSCCIELWSRRWLLALWLCRLEEYFFTSQPEAFVDVHHMCPLQLFEGRLQSMWTEAQLGRGRQRCVANELCHSSVSAPGRNQGVGSSACCTTRQCRPLWKSTSPSGREASTRSQRGARRQTFVLHVRPFFGNQPTCTNSPFHDEVVFSHSVLYSCDSSER